MNHKNNSNKLPVRGRPPEPGINFLLVVPPPARGLKLTELPISVRLEGVLQQLGHQTLGDLNKVDVRVLLAERNCGRTTITELKEIIRRAGEGEFSVSVKRDLNSNLFALAGAIDSAFGELSKRDRKIYEMRLVGKSGRRRTLEQIGTEFKMTRERVRQIIREATQKLVRGGGPKFARALEAIAADCQKKNSQLTLHQLSEWYEDCTGLAHPPQFYVGVLYHTDQYWTVAATTAAR